MLPKGTRSRAKTGPIASTGFRGWLIGPSCFTLSQSSVWTGGVGYRASPCRHDNDNDVVTIRLQTSWSLSALFMLLAILLGMNMPQVNGSNRSNNVEV